jgi:quercetin dioxygenase-like cupin family protein
MRKVYVLGILIAGWTGLSILHAQEKPAPKPSNMGGSVTGGLVTNLGEVSKSSIAHFRFDPGARTKWHTHEVGQIVLCEEGICLTQEKGGPVLQLKPGDVVYSGPGVMHWHGAAPDQGCVQFNVSRGASTFLDEVTDKDYRGPRKKL